MLKLSKLGCRMLRISRILTFSISTGSVWTDIFNLQTMWVSLVLMRSKLASTMRVLWKYGLAISINTTGFWDRGLGNRRWWGNYLIFCSQKLIRSLEGGIRILLGLLEIMKRSLLERLGTSSISTWKKLFRETCLRDLTVYLIMVESTISKLGLWIMMEIWWTAKLFRLLMEILKLRTGVSLIEVWRENQEKKLLLLNKNQK